MSTSDRQLGLCGYLFILWLSVRVCVCMRASNTVPLLMCACVLVTSAVLYHMSARPQALTSPSFARCPFYLEKRTRGKSSIIQRTTTNQCLANNNLRKPCNKRVHSNPMSSHVTDLSRFQVSQIDQSRLFEKKQKQRTICRNEIFFYSHTEWALISCKWWPSLV